MSGSIAYALTGPSIVAVTTFHCFDMRQSQTMTDSSQPAFDVATLAQTWSKPMLRFALLHLQPPEEAEDAVQDTLLALLKVQPAALKQNDPRHYLFGILKNKIADRLRSKYRSEVSYHEAFGDSSAENDVLDQELFDAQGHWQPGMAPAVWYDPESHMQHSQFFMVVDLCVHQLPPKVARVFSMKELLECDSAEVCDILGLSKTDYWQCMSRARKQLQICLNQKWFNLKDHSAS